MKKSVLDPMSGEGGALFKQINGHWGISEFNRGDYSTRMCELVINLETGSNCEGGKNIINS